MGKKLNVKSWQTQNYFFPGWFKFKFASVKKITMMKKSILNMSLDEGCETSPAVQQHRTRQ